MLEYLEKIPPLGGIFDTHAHFDDEKFDGIRGELIEGLFSKGLEGIITCGCDIPSSLKAISLSEKYEKIYAAAGFHPENLPSPSPEGSPELLKLEQLLNKEKVVAIGEIGLDYYWDIPREPQKAWFKAQLELAIKHSIPVIIHDREAHSDTLEILKQYMPKGVLHCFSGSRETMRELIKMGMYIGVGGVVTFKNARKAVEVVEELPLDRLLLETDCPYLAPEPFRGKLCHSGLIAFTAAKIAQIKGMPENEIRKISFENTKKLFNI